MRRCSTSKTHVRLDAYVDGEERITDEAFGRKICLMKVFDENTDAFNVKIQMRRYCYPGLKEHKEEKIKPADILKKLKKTETLKDMKIRAIDGTEVAIHRCVLAAHSDNQYSENEVVTVNCNKKTLELLVEFLYSGHLPPKVPADIPIPDLARAAKRLQIKAIQKKYWGQLCDNLTVDNFVEVLKRVYQLECEDGRKKLAEFYEGNYSRITEHASWETAMSQGHWKLHEYLLRRGRKRKASEMLQK